MVIAVTAGQAVAAVVGFRKFPRYRAGPDQNEALRGSIEMQFGSGYIQNQAVFFHHFDQALVRFSDREAFVHSALVDPCMHLEKRPHMTFCRGPNSHHCLDLEAPLLG